MAIYKIDILFYITHMICYIKLLFLIAISFQIEKLRQLSCASLTIAAPASLSPEGMFPQFYSDLPLMLLLTISLMGLIVLSIYRMQYNLHIKDTLGTI